MTTSRFGGSIGWGLIALSSVGVGGYALFKVATGLKYLGVQNTFPSPLGMEIHITAAGVALLIGAFQFLKVLRNRMPIVHRWVGRIYVVACTAGGIAGGMIALYTTSGMPAGLGFLTLAVLWTPITLLGWINIRNRNYIAHERWMIRSFALTFAAVTLRIYLPIAIIQNHGEFPVHAYQVIAWMAWVPNLIVAEILIRSQPRLRLRRKVAVAVA